MTRRQHTGEVCPQSGLWVFIGYFGRKSSIPPTPDEMIIWLDAGHRFPPVRSTCCAVERVLMS